jgi:heme/copper-type cytochrome/quinol oxidase subunit 2
VTASRDRSSRAPALVLLGCLSLAVAAGATIVAQSRKDFSVSARKYAYKVSAGGGEVPDIRVQLDDMVTVTFSAEDIAHSFTIGDHYRIDRRAEPGKPVTIRFKADKEGAFEIRCTLTIDDRCVRDMKGRLVVEGKKVQK